MIGLGSWQTLDVSNSQRNPIYEQIFQTLYTGGGRLIDSSPMYGRSEKVIGDITSTMEVGDEFFYATKVWTNGMQEGIRQVENSLHQMRRSRLDLVQVHNLVDWQTHIRSLRRFKEQDRLRYIGITHYTDASHEALEKIINTEPIDFVQFNYSLTERHAEERLLGAASDAGVATIINRPLGAGLPLKRVVGKPVPQWAAEAGMDTWSSFFLKYILAHPAVTCVIPATSNSKHAIDNIAAGSGPLPDEALRRRMVDYIKQL
ncbi:aldo/keto reductase [Spirosoma pulveris]